MIVLVSPGIVLILLLSDDISGSFSIRLKTAFMVRLVLLASHLFPCFNLQKWT